MAEGWRILYCLAASGLMLALLQQFAARNGKISPAGHTLAVLLGMCTACLFLLLTARPCMAALLNLALMLLFLVCNRAKEQALREPLYLADAYLLRQACKYPHLYVPFVPTKLIAAGLLLLVPALAVLLHLEAPLAVLRRPGTAVILLGAVLALPAFLFLARSGRLPGPANAVLRVFPASADAAKDAIRNGYVAALVNHPVWLGAWKRGQPDFLRDCNLRPAASRFPGSLETLLAELEATPPENMPHIMLIQAESFCDIRKHASEPLKSVLADFLPNWDRLKAQGRAFDPPENAYGAYTMRTEFAMLTGLHAHDLGPWSFNPYLLAARQPMWSLARHLAAKGYGTLCIHPYHKDFFSRDRVMPNLGFQRFLGIDELEGLEKFGPYASDAALAERIGQETAAAEASGRPLFCFAITMEAHGPWLPGRLTENEMAAVLPEIDAGLCQPELRLYLCHLRHMDGMFGLLAQGMDSGKGRPGHLLAYGDHAPSGVMSPP